MFNSIKKLIFKHKVKEYKNKYIDANSYIVSRKCPRCGKVYHEYPALSRKDNKTQICSSCGIVEALLAFQGEQDKPWYIDKL